MLHPPERPFVPRPTPSKGQPALGGADFALSRPFVPGADRARIAAARIEGENESGLAMPTSIPR